MTARLQSSCEEGAQSTLFPPSLCKQSAWLDEGQDSLPHGGLVSGPDAGRTKHQAGPIALSLSHSLGFPSWRTHRHLPRAAAGASAPPLPSQVLSEALEHPQGQQTRFSFQAERREEGERMGGPVV